MSLFDFTQDASDPNNPNATLTTPDQVARRQQMAAELMKQGADYSPVRSPWQGAARMANAMLGAYMNYKEGQNAQDANKANSDALTAAMLGLKGGSSPAMAPATPPAPASASMPTQMGAALASDGKPAPVPPANIPMQPYRDAIASIESKGSGDYSALGPATNGDRAYGRYQVMGSNIPAWTKAALGQSLTPQQFLADPKAQDAVFDYQFGQNMQKYGNPNDAASVWFTGRPQAQGGNSRDVLGTSGNGYVNKFAQALAGQPSNGPAAQAIAQAAPQQVASTAPGLGYAPNTAPAAPPPGPLSNFAPIPGSAPIAPAGFNGPVGVPPNASPADAAAAAGAADPVAPNPDVPAPGAVNAGPAPVQPDPILAATAARAAHPQPGDQMIPLDQLRPGSAAYPNMEGSPEAAQAQQAQQAVQMQQLMGVIQNPYSTPAQRQIATMVMQKYIGQDQVKTITDKDGSIWQQKPDGSLTLVQDKGKIEVIGKDAMGNPTYGTRAQVEGRTPAAAPAATQPAVDPNLRGQDYLKQMPPDVQSHIQAVIEGREDYPSPQQLKMPYWKNIADGVQAVDPTFQIGNAGARKKLMVDATSGKMADTTNALNTAIGHLGELSDQAEALSNRSGLSIATQPYNYLTNKAQQLSGNPAQTNFESTRGKVAEELVKAYRGAGGAESDIQRELGAITESQSPEQLRGAIKNAATLLQSKIEANQKQWDDGMGPMAAKRDFLSPKARAVIDGINQRADGKAVKSVIPAEGAAPQGGATATPARKTLGGKTYEQRGSDWYEVN